MQYPGFQFEITAKDAGSAARTGRLITPHGTIETPNFIFCATKGALKAVTTDQARAAGADFLLSNTYHLLINPGPDWVAASGGLHRLLAWDGPLLTDSGGFQIFSLGHGTVADEIKGRRDGTRPPTLLKIDEDGAVFRSYLDGSVHQLTPELSIDAQRKFGTDFVVVLDECTPFHADRDYTARAMERSHRWERRSLEEFARRHDGRQALYGIVQGGVYPDLRAASAQFVAEQPFFGQAVGGSLGGTKEQMYEVVDLAMAGLRRERPTHLLGIGNVGDIWEGVARGIDTFDCVSPTRLARHGGALARPAFAEGHDHLSIENSRYREDFQAIEADCDCHTCQRFTRAHLHYLLRAGEMLALQLLTIHNIAFMARLMRTVRAAIRADRLADARREYYGSAG